MYLSAFGLPLARFPIPVPTDDTAAGLRARLTAETGPVTWPELERHFARGRVVHVTPELGLVEVAARMVEDDRDTVSAWIDAGQIGPATDRQARDWQARAPRFRAVVAAPWVLVQEDTEE